MTITNKQYHSECPHCGTKFREYKHNLNYGLVCAMLHMYRNGYVGRAELRELKFGGKSIPTTYNNIHFLVSLELAEQKTIKTMVNGKEKRTKVYVLTKKGFDFIHRGIEVEDQVWILSSSNVGRPIRFESGKTTLEHIMGHKYEEAFKTWQREDFIENRIPGDYKKYFEETLC